MAVWIQLGSSEFEYLRLDGEYYHPEHIQDAQAFERIRRVFPVEKLKRLIVKPVKTGRTPGNREFNNGDDAVAFVKTDHVRNGAINFNDTGDLPKRILRDSDLLKTDDILVTIIGATPEIVGRTAIIDRFSSECTTNQNVAVITTNSLCDPYYLTSYFQTRIGRSQFWRHSRRAGQVNLNCRECERVLVPLPPDAVQREIGNLLRNSFSCTEESKNLYQQAQKLLESELGLDKLTVEKPIGYTANFSDVVGSNRADPEFFHTLFEPYLKAITSYSNGSISLKRICSRVFPSFQPKQAKGVYSYVEIGDVSVSDGSYQMNQVNATDLPANAKIMPSGGEIIVSMVRPTRGAISMLDDEIPEKTVCSGAFYVFKVTQVESREAIWLYLRSIRSVFEKYCGGTSYPTIESHYIADFPVPLFAPDFEAEISALVKASITKKRESLELLEQAKTRVEELIEEAIKS
jgi:hypothetical protein